MYVNIHTAAHKAGEIRGQVVEVAGSSIRSRTSLPAGPPAGFFMAHSCHGLRLAGASFARFASAAAAIYLARKTM